MTELDRFKVEQTLEMIENLLEHNSNSCEFEFFKELKEKLAKKLKE